MNLLGQFAGSDDDRLARSEPVRNMVLEVFRPLGGEVEDIDLRGSGGCDLREARRRHEVDGRIIVMIPPPSPRAGSRVPWDPFHPVIDLIFTSAPFSQQYRIIVGGAVGPLPIRSTSAVERFIEFGKLQERQQHPSVGEAFLEIGEGTLNIYER